MQECASLAVDFYLLLLLLVCADDNYAPSVLMEKGKSEARISRSLSSFGGRSKFLPFCSSNSFIHPQPLPIIAPLLQPKFRPLLWALLLRQLQLAPVCTGEIVDVEPLFPSFQSSLPEEHPFLRSKNQQPTNERTGEQRGEDIRSCFGLGGGEKMNKNLNPLVI